jgi:hypothetical protein
VASRGFCSSAGLIKVAAEVVQMKCKKEHLK